MEEKKLLHKIQKVEITDELKESYIDYAMSVIVSRAIPDVRDGLKPVQRRILWAMWDSGLKHNVKFRKSANVVGEVLGRYHPHGDTAVYDAMARMAQDFSLRYPLIDGQGNWGCFTKDTKIKLTDNRELSFGELVEEYERGKKNYTYTLNRSGFISVAEIKKPRMTIKNAELIKVILDNGKEVRCTPNHLFMMRDGDYKEAQNLSSGDSLMPLYQKISEKTDRLNRKGYILIYQPKKNEWVPAHHLADNYNLTDKKYLKDAGRVRHHIDFNKLNNNPDNIVRIQWGDHWKIHYTHAADQHKNPEYRQKIADGRNKYLANPETKIKYANLLSERNKKNWQDEKYREKMRKFLSEVNKKYIAEHPEKRMEFSARLTRTLKRQWQDPHYQALMHERIIKGNKNHINNKTGKLKFLNICKEVIKKHNSLDELKYEQARNELYPYGAATLWETGLVKYFQGDTNLIYQELNSNHKVVKVEKLNTREDVYDLTIEGTHNFSLADGVFVHNSVDGDSPAAMRYCITGDTRVVTNNGLVKIKNLGTDTAEENINIAVLSKDRGINKATKWFDSGKHPTIKIRTRNGFAIQGSYNHPILTWSNDTERGYPWFKWKLLQEIKKGDVAVIDRTPDLLWPEKNISLISLWPNHGNRRTERKILPKELDENLAHIFGALIAEGTIKKNEIEFCNSDPIWISEFQKRWQAVFPDCRLHLFERKPNSFGKKPYQTIEIHSRYVIEFLRNCGLDPVTSAYKHVPEVIFSSPKKVVAEFLRAFFEGDGSISHSDTMTELSCISISEQLIDEIQILLLRFGIAAAKRFDTYRSTHKLYIRSLKNYKFFEECIGFVSFRKQLKLHQVIELLHKDYSTTDYIPFLRDAIYDVLRKNYSQKEFALKHNFDRYGNLLMNGERVLSTITDENKESAEQLFHSLLANTYLFDTILDIEQGGIEQVYSIRVDSQCHSFVANGFINHNTEARMAKIAEDILTDIEKETVEWQPNYDNSRVEPKFMPGKLPNLLLNGTMGIAVGMATSIPPHNLLEIADATNYLIDNPDASVKDLMKFIPGPDFPTGGVIYDKSSIEQAYATGRGSVTIRGVANIEERKSESYQIVITEIPYQVNKADLIVKMAELAQEKKIEGIKDLRDESDREGMRITVDLKHDAVPQKVLNQLFEYTELQKNFHFNMVALDYGVQPRIFSLKEILSAYIDHRKIMVKKRVEFDLKKAEERAHILMGLVKALGVIDKIIATIKKSKDKEDAQQNLIKIFKFTVLQANAILEMKLQSLAALERLKLEDELKEKRKIITELQDILAHPKKILGIITNELGDLKKTFPSERKTKMVSSGLKEFKAEDLIPQEEAVVMFTQDGYIKRLPPATFKAQKRGGKGLIGFELKEEDLVRQFISAETHDNILFFTDRGRVFQTKVYEIPVATRTAKGKSIYNFLEIPTTEKVNAMIAYSDANIRMHTNDTNNENKYLVMVTEKGIIKKTLIADFTNVRRTGIIALKLKSDDILRWAALSSGSDEILLSTAQGQAIRFKEKDVRAMGRTASGVTAMRLKKGDTIAGLDIINIGDKKHLTSDKRQTTGDKKHLTSDKRQATGDKLLAVMANGFGKQTLLKEYKIQRRGGSGIKTAKVTAKTGPVIATYIVNDEIEEILAFSTKGQALRTKLKDIRIAGRATQGVRIINLSEGDTLVGMVCL